MGSYSNEYKLPRYEMNHRDTVLHHPQGVGGYGCAVPGDRLSLHGAASEQV